ncbi:MAG TPA: hypothetical protein VF515_18710 [Candidatus Binatia bacterium]
MHDVTFLQTVANQVALGLTNAFAIGQLEELNASLERQVQDRTAALATSNAELNLSLEKLRTAYQLLERNQSSLVRADRLATLGRLTAGIAHEINTPLGALLNSVKILSDLGQEFPIPSMIQAFCPKITMKSLLTSLALLGPPPSGHARQPSSSRR